MATKLISGVSLVALLVLTACSAPWTSASTSTSQSESTRPATQTGAALTATTTTSSTSTPVPSTTVPSPTTTLPTPTVVAPSPTPVPTSSIREGAIADCCGVFSWLDSQTVLVFDSPSNGKQGAWLVDVTSGSRQLVTPTFGVPSSSGLIAFSNQTQGVTEIRKTDGGLVSTIQNGGVLTWISPNGKHIAWLQDLGVPNTSSLVNRVVELKTADIDGSNVKSLVKFEAAAVTWLPDNKHVVALARAPGGTQSGIWTVDTTNGTNAVVVSATFVRALNVSANGTRMAYLVTFSGDQSKDGVWVADVDGSHAIHLKEVSAFRWAGDANHLWFLQLAAPGGGEDHLVKVDIRNDSVVETVGLGGRVLNGEWQVNPAGNVVVFWSEADKSVEVKALRP